jgi:hypothetical protein
VCKENVTVGTRLGELVWVEWSQTIQRGDALFCFTRGSIRGSMGLADLTGVEGMVPHAHHIAYLIEECSEPRNTRHFIGSIKQQESNTEEQR